MSRRPRRRPHHRPHRRPAAPLVALVALLGAAAALVGMLLAPLPGATAVPGGGADPDTPGTSASVSPRTLRAGETISFTLGGFPAGEVVSIKIDDGRFCAEVAVHGACVVHQQRIPASGTVSGSFVLPADLTPGAHWLRFLASEEVIKDGAYAGVKGYTRRGGADFTVLPGMGTSGTGTTGTTDDGAPAAGGTTADVPGVPGQQVVPAGEVLSVVPAAASAAAPAEGPDATGADDGPGDAAGEATAAVAADPVVVDGPAEPAENGFPFLGAAGLAALLVAAAAVLLRALRRPTAG